MKNYKLLINNFKKELNRQIKFSRLLKHPFVCLFIRTGTDVDSSRLSLLSILISEEIKFEC